MSVAKESMGSDESEKRKARLLNKTCIQKNCFLPHKIKLKISLHTVMI